MSLASSSYLPVSLSKARLAYRALLALALWLHQAMRSMNIWGLLGPGPFYSFILVVLAALGAFMVTISTTQQIGSALDVQRSRAYQAARSGIEWGVYQVQATTLAYNFGHANDPASTSPNLRSCFSPTRTSFSFPNAPTLIGFTVTVTCADTHACELRSDQCEPTL